MRRELQAIKKNKSQKIIFQCYTPHGWWVFEPFNFGFLKRWLVHWGLATTCYYNTLPYQIVSLPRYNFLQQVGYILVLNKIRIIILILIHDFCEFYPS